MIKEEELFQIGNLHKPHAIHGEMSATFTSHSVDLDECPFMVLNIDGIFVPFFIESYRYKTDTTALIKFEGIDSEEEAKRLSNLSIYLPLKYRQENQDNENDIHYFTGFKVIDSALGELGRITDIDDSTANVLFIITTLNGEELLIPATDDFVEKIDEKNRILLMNLPEGIFSL
ncbi:MAG: ribosome maturation factor RimM [Prevotellaceae bacterium]|jgi:16S rRNA processing protein RimM|nr:ribosome maturation factor RimM [Prevotellaceae bacterium]